MDSQLHNALARRLVDDGDESTTDASENSGGFRSPVSPSAKAGVGGVSPLASRNPDGDDGGRNDEDEDDLLLSLTDIQGGGLTEATKPEYFRRANPNNSTALSSGSPARGGGRGVRVAIRHVATATVGGSVTETRQSLVEDVVVAAQKLADAHGQIAQLKADLSQAEVNHALASGRLAGRQRALDVLRATLWRDLLNAQAVIKQQGGLAGFTLEAFERLFDGDVGVTDDDDASSSPSSPDGRIAEMIRLAVEHQRVESRRQFEQRLAENEAEIRRLQIQVTRADEIEANLHQLVTRAVDECTRAHTRTLSDTQAEHEVQLQRLQADFSSKLDVRDEEIAKLQLNLREALRGHGGSRRRGTTFGGSIRRRHRSSSALGASMSFATGDDDQQSTTSPHHHPSMSPAGLPTSPTVHSTPSMNRPSSPSGASGLSHSLSVAAETVSSEEGDGSSSDEDSDVAELREELQAAMARAESLERQAAATQSTLLEKDKAVDRMKQLVAQASQERGKLIERAETAEKNAAQQQQDAAKVAEERDEAQEKWTDALASVARLEAQVQHATSAVAAQQNSPQVIVPVQRTLSDGGGSNDGGRRSSSPMHIAAGIDSPSATDKLQSANEALQNDLDDAQYRLETAQRDLVKYRDTCQSLESLRDTQESALESCARVFRQVASAVDNGLVGHMESLKTLIAAKPTDPTDEATTKPADGVCRLAAAVGILCQFGVAYAQRKATPSEAAVTRTAAAMASETALYSPKLSKSRALETVASSGALVSGGSLAQALKRTAAMDLSEVDLSPFALVFSTVAATTGTSASGSSPSSSPDGAHRRRSSARRGSAVAGAVAERRGVRKPSLSPIQRDSSPGSHSAEDASTTAAVTPPKGLPRTPMSPPNFTTSSVATASVAVQTDDVVDHAGVVRDRLTPTLATSTSRNIDASAARLSLVDVKQRYPHLRDTAPLAAAFANLRYVDKMTVLGSALGSFASPLELVPVLRQVEGLSPAADALQRHGDNQATVSSTTVATGAAKKTMGHRSTSPQQEGTSARTDDAKTLDRLQETIRTLTTSVTELTRDSGLIPELIADAVRAEGQHDIAREQALEALASLSEALFDAWAPSHRPDPVVSPTPTTGAKVAVVGPVLFRDSASPTELVHPVTTDEEHQPSSSSSSSSGALQVFLGLTQQLARAIAHLHTAAAPLRTLPARINDMTRDVRSRQALGVGKAVTLDVQATTGLVAHLRTLLADADDDTATSPMGAAARGSRPMSPLRGRVRRAAPGSFGITAAGMSKDHRDEQLSSTQALDIDSRAEGHLAYAGLPSGAPAAPSRKPHAVVDLLPADVPQRDVKRPMSATVSRLVQKAHREKASSGSAQHQRATAERPSSALQVSLHALAPPDMPTSGGDASSSSMAPQLVGAQQQQDDSLLSYFGGDVPCTMISGSAPMHQHHSRKAAANTSTDGDDDAHAVQGDEEATTSKHRPPSPAVEVQSTATATPVFTGANPASAARSGRDHEASSGSPARVATAEMQPRATSSSEIYRSRGVLGQNVVPSSTRRAKHREHLRQLHAIPDRVIPGSSLSSSAAAHDESQLLTTTANTTSVGGDALTKAANGRPASSGGVKRPASAKFRSSASRQVAQHRQSAAGAAKTALRRQHDLPRYHAPATAAGGAIDPRQALAENARREQAPKTVLDEPGALGVMLISSEPTTRSAPLEQSETA